MTAEPLSPVTPCGSRDVYRYDYLWGVGLYPDLRTTKNLGTSKYRRWAEYFKKEIFYDLIWFIYRVMWGRGIHSESTKEGVFLFRISRFWTYMIWSRWK